MQSILLTIRDPARAKAFFEEKVAFTTGPVELDHMLKSGENNIVVVDVRDAEDYRKSHIPSAINLPRETWDSARGLSKDKTNIVYCYSQNCHLAANACVAFASKGFPVMELDGGFAVWKEHDLDTEPGLANRLRQMGEKAIHPRR